MSFNHRAIKYLKGGDCDEDRVLSAVIDHQPIVFGHFVREPFNFNLLVNKFVYKLIRGKPQPEYGFHGILGLRTSLDL